MNRNIIYWAVCAAFVMIGLGGFDLSPPDEPRFALVAQEMMRDGQWLLPHRNERAYPDKPPLFFWSIAGFSYLSGGEVSPWSARFPSALAALGVAILLFRWERRETGNAVPLSPLVALAAFKLMHQAHMAQIDMLLCFLTTLAALEGYALVNGSKNRQMAMGLAMGFGILAKGPVALIIPLGGCAIFLACSRSTSWRRFPARAIAWSLLPPAVWLTGLGIQVWVQDQWAYFTNLLFDQTVVRYLNPWHHHKPFTYFFVTILHDFFPWSLLLYFAIPFSRKRRIELTKAELFSWCMLAFTILFFSLSKGKRNLYILPAFPFAAYAVIGFLQRARDRSGKGLPIVASLSPLIWIIVAAAFAAIGSGLFRPLEIARIPNLPAWQMLTAATLVLLSSCTCLWAIWTRRWRQFVFLNVANSLALGLLVFTAIMPWINPSRSVKPFVKATTQMMQAVAQPNAQLGMVDFRSAFRLYGDRRVWELATLNPNESSPKLINLPDLKEFASASDDPWVIIRESDLAEFTFACELPDFEVVWQDPIPDRNRYLLIRFRDEPEKEPETP